MAKEIKIIKCVDFGRAFVILQQATLAMRKEKIAIEALTDAYAVNHVIAELSLQNISIKSSPEIVDAIAIKCRELVIREFKVPEHKREYLENGGVRCLYCKSDNITSGPLDADGPTATAMVECHNCMKRWADTYTLTSVGRD